MLLNICSDYCRIRKVSTTLNSVVFCESENLLHTVFLYFLSSFDAEAKQAHAFRATSVLPDMKSRSVAKAEKELNRPVMDSQQQNLVVVFLQRVGVARL